MVGLNSNHQAWNALASVAGLGPRRLVGVALRLGERHRIASELLGASPTELQELGLGAALARRVADALAEPPEPVPAPPGVRLLCPDDAFYPIDRLDGSLPLPVLLYCRGELSLVTSGGVAVSGSRAASEVTLHFAAEVAKRLAKSSVNIISGQAAGVDEAAHAAALAAGGTTTAVLAEGLLNFQPRSALRSAAPESALFVSEFDPSAGWSVYNAMKRNTTIAALADVVVVVVAANLRGGSWAQAKLCLEAGKRLLVPAFPSSIAPGNQRLIEMGAIPISPRDPTEVLQHLAVERPSSPSQLRMFG